VASRRTPRQSFPTTDGFHTPPKLRKVAALSANVVFDAMGYPNIALLKGNDSHALLVRVSHVDILQMITFAPYAM
jgi:hypothetical protein